MFDRFSHIFASFREKRNVYIAILASVGVLLVFIIPPFQSPDEQTHLYRAYQLSEGQVIAQKLSYGVGDMLPASLSNAFEQFRYLMFNPEAKVNEEIYQTAWSQPLDAQNVRETRFENTAAYPFVAYIPQAIGMLLSRVFDAGPLQLLYLARLFNLVVWLGLLWLAMKWMPRLSLPLFAFALIPIVTFQASSVSADAATIGIALLFVINVFRLATNTKLLTRHELVLLAITTGLLALCKLPYVLLAMLVVMIPKELFRTTKQYYIYKLAIPIGAFAISGMWLLLAKETYLNLREIANTPAQLHFIVTQPFDYMRVLFQTYVGQPSDALYAQIGMLGWLDTKLPLWAIIATYCSVLLAIITVPMQGLKMPIMRWQRLWSIGLGFIIVGAITTLLYLTWNTPRASVVEGLQIRYFMPLFGLAIIAAVGWLQLTKKQAKQSKIIIYSLSGLSVIAMVASIFLRYY